LLITISLSLSYLIAALNTTVANIIRFVYNAADEIQSLYGYGQDGKSLMRSDDRGKTWLVTHANEYSTVSDALPSAGQRISATSLF
jgi:hypothetical protein